MRLLGGLSPRRRLLFGLVAGAALVLVGTLAGRALWPDPGRPTGRPDQNRPGPVLLVPGYGGNRGSLLPLADRIHATGRTATVLTLPGDGTGDLVAQAAILQSAVASALAGGAPSVDLVGYSAGGVVVRLWVARYGGQAARRVVTLGSPLHGTQLAALGTALVPAACPTACQQLVPGSSLLAGLSGPPPAGLPWLSVWTRVDQTVTPPDSAVLAGAVNVAVQDVCPQSTVPHGGLPSDPAVTAFVLGALGTAPLTTPATCVSS